MSVLFLLFLYMISFFSTGWAAQLMKAYRKYKHTCCRAANTLCFDNDLVPRFDRSLHPQYEIRRKGHSFECTVGPTSVEQCALTCMWDKTCRFFGYNWNKQGDCTILNSCSREQIQCPYGDMYFKAHQWTRPPTAAPVIPQPLSLDALAACAKIRSPRKCNKKKAGCRWDSGEGVCLKPPATDVEEACGGRRGKFKKARKAIDISNIKSPCDCRDLCVLHEPVVRGWMYVTETLDCYCMKKFKDQSLNPGSASVVGKI